MQFTFLIQARLGSSRLPGKIMLPFYEEHTILDLLIEKLKCITTNIVLATSENSQNDLLKDVSDKHHIKCFRGAENDVLQRFVDAAETHHAKHIIRVCSDNPFLDLEAIKELIQFVESAEGKYDYVSFDIFGLPSIKTHYGFWTEYVTLSALKKICSLTDNPCYHEHVTNYIYTHPENFSIAWIKGPECLRKHSDIRLTIDTEEDFKNAAEIYADLCIATPYPTVIEIVNYLDNHSDYYQYMRSQILKNSK
ncbi:MAG: hypothetical protein NC410_01345 [Oscillibacter sp.]|nr:hypothetical protein [Oscillibacter sp.]